MSEFFKIFCIRAFFLHSVSGLEYLQTFGAKKLVYLARWNKLEFLHETWNLFWSKKVWRNQDSSNFRVLYIRGI